MWTLILLLLPMCCARLVSRLDGDIMLGALFPIHGRGSSADGCGSLQADDGIQPLEALLYTLDQINDSNLLANIKLGVVALDSCDSIVRALDQCLDFVQGYVETDFVATIQQNSSCSGADLISLANKPIVGVIGDQRSDISVQVASLLRVFKIPLISYQSTSPTLSHRERFANFFRTVPSDVTQAYAILEILKHFNWTYTSLIYSASEYGIKGYETLTDKAPAYGVCFDLSVRIDPDQFNDADYDAVVNRLRSQSARVAVLFTDKRVARRLMAAVRRANFQNLIWVGSDGWSNREVVTQEHEVIVEGAITVQPLVRQLAGFDTYFLNLKPSKEGRNPWFTQYWQEHFKCNLPDNSLPAGIKATDYTMECKRDLSITNVVEMKYLHFVRDAVYAYAHALHAMHRDLCPDDSGVCPKMRRQMRDLLTGYIANATFEDESKKTFRFYNGSDGPPRYSVLNFQKMNDDSYAWKEIGTFSLGAEDKPELIVNRTAVQYRRYKKYPNSTCVQRCDPSKGLVPHGQSNSSCCPACKKCRYEEYVSGGECVACHMGWKPNENRSGCQLIDEEIINFRNPWAAATIAFASLGIIMTLAVAFVFWRHRHTPIIKAAGRELSAVLLAAILLSFCKTFIITANPTPTVCGLTRFSLGLTHTISFAAIAVKTNRVARIFGQRSGAPVAACPRAKYISPASQLAITAVLTLIGVIINSFWLVYKEPQTTHVSPTRDRRVLICSGMDDFSYLIGLLYPCVLVGCCTVYAFQTRKCPGGFNEARYIAFTTYTTCVLWLSFVPLYVTSTSPTVRIVTLAMSLSISGVVQLACLFAPKVYVVLCKPEKNTREGVMAHHRTSSYALATPPTAGFNSQNQGFQSSINGSQMNRQHPPTVIENRDSTLTASCIMNGADEMSTSPSNRKGNNVHFSEPEHGHTEVGTEKQSDSTDHSTL